MSSVYDIANEIYNTFVDKGEGSYGGEIIVNVKQGELIVKEYESVITIYSTERGLCVDTPESFYREEDLTKNEMYDILMYLE
jgi:hypothetical protein